MIIPQPNFHKKTNKWQARITINGKRKYLGLFDSYALADEEITKLLFKGDNTFKKIPGTKNYYISKSGKIKNALHKILKLSKSKSGYNVVNLEKSGLRRPYYVGRLVFETYNKKVPRILDHIDRDRQNDNISNLREVTSAQNNMNRTKRDGCASQYIGVYYNKRVNKWVATIKVNGKTKSLGYYNDEVDAAKARDEASVKYFNQYASLNFK